MDITTEITQILIAGVAAIVTMTSGVMFSWLALKNRRERELSLQRIDEISSAVRNQNIKTQVQMIRQVAEKLPEGLALDDFESALNMAVASTTYKKASASLDGEEQSLVTDLVIGYHSQALSQARVQFYFSVAAASIGFVYIIYTGLLAMNTDGAGYLDIVPGVVIEAVAALFFKQAEETRERATALYDRLRQDREHADAERMVDAIEDEKIKSVVRAQIALHKSGMGTSQIELGDLLREN